MYQYLVFQYPLFSRVQNGKRSFRKILLWGHNFRHIQTYSVKMRRRFYPFSTLANPEIYSKRPYFALKMQKKKGPLHSENPIIFMAGRWWSPTNSTENLFLPQKLEKQIYGDRNGKQGEGKQIINNLPI